MAIQAQLYSENLAGYAMGAPPQDVVMGNACGFDNNLCFIPQKPQQQQLQQLMQFDQFQNLAHQKNQNFVHDKNVGVSQQQSMAFSQNISAHLEKQRLEIDHFINIQNERLRQAIQEQRKQQIALFLKRYEAKAQFLLRQKEEEVANAKSRTMELESFLKNMEIENQTWQRAAQENESMVASLNSTIQRLRESACLLSANAAEDQESWCQDTEKEDQNVVQSSMKMVCRCCNSRRSCVIMLPCRHLCSCRECEVSLDSCPVCKMVKEASVEALI